MTTPTDRLAATTDLAAHAEALLDSVAALALSDTTDLALGLAARLLLETAEALHTSLTHQTTVARVAAEAAAGTADRRYADAPTAAAAWLRRAKRGRTTITVCVLGGGWWELTRPSDRHPGALRHKRVQGLSALAAYLTRLGVLRAVDGGVVLVGGGR